MVSDLCTGQIRQKNRMNLSETANTVYLQKILFNKIMCTQLNH